MPGDRAIPSALLSGALVTVGEVLDRANIEWCMIGSLGQGVKNENEHTDVDLCIRPGDAADALDALRESQLPAFDFEGWIVKTYVGSVLVDIIYRPDGVSSEQFLASAVVNHVKVVRWPAASRLLCEKSYEASAK